VKRLHDRYFGFAAGIVCGRRDQGKRIVEVRDVRVLAVNDFTDVGSAIRGPERTQGKSGLCDQTVATDLVVVARIGANQVAASGQEVTLVFENDVFTAVLLVRIVDHENLHRWHFSGGIAWLNAALTR
jgi:hypothetical protein